ncbi:MAG: glycosyltransferase [Candidatus Acidiferrales bacterium]
MRAIFLAPGLSRVTRGYERFVLDLAAQLRRGSIDATCWGTSDSPGVESIAVPARDDLWKFALDRLRADPRFSSLTAEAFQDWGVYAEDQLFAIPAAARISELLKQNEPLLIYAKWQGGLVDPSGAPTQLLKLLASASLEGKASLVVHTDYLHAPIASLLWKAGANFHALGPWITGELLQLGVTREGIIELPMCVDAASYKDCRLHRARKRREMGIPADAFVILSVGSFDSTTPDKRHAHLLREIESLAPRHNVWWVVAGSRGPAPTRWEQEAREALGAQFVPLPNVPFKRMPQIYGMADLFALASTDETFGLVYLEAQIAGLPVVIHDNSISRHICSGLASARRKNSLAAMRRVGPGAAAIDRWITLMERSATGGAELRTALDDFAQQQAQRFGWESVGPQYAAAFQTLGQSQSRATPAKRRNFGTWDEQTHRQALRLFEEGKPREALMFFGRALGGRETGERWNDWAAAQVALKQSAEAEQGFRRALEIDPRQAQAAANLGALLAGSGRESQAIPLLAQAHPGVDSEQQAAISQLLGDCRAKQAASEITSDTDIANGLRTFAAFDSRSEIQFREQLSYFLAVLKAVPHATSDSRQRLLGIGGDARGLATAFARWRGYRDIRWRSAIATLGAENIQFAGEDEDFPATLRFDHFGIVGAWPYPDQFFDFIFIGQTLETLSRDPMAALATANRVLKMGGQLLLTAPNLASAHAVHAVLHGKTPYVDGRFAPGSNEPGERHNREYAPTEIELLAKAAGFATVRMETHDLYWQPPEKIFPALAASGYPVGLRGDTILLVARKEAPVRDRFPAALYDLSDVPMRAENRRNNHSSIAGAVPIPGNPRSVRGERPLRILVAHENLPRPDQSGAEFRLLQILRELREQGHAVTYLAARGFEEDRYAPALAALGIEVYSSDAQVLRREGIESVPRWTLQEVLREGQFDLAIFYLWFWMSVSIPEYYLDEIRGLSPGTRIAVLTDDCHGLRELRGAGLSRAWSDRERAEDYREREFEILRSADFVFAISEDDRKRLLENSQRLEIALLPVAIDAAPPGASFDERNGLMYLADYNNPASRDGIEWYLKQVAPIVRNSLPDVPVYLAGAGLRSDIGEGHSGVVRVGFVPELASEFSKRRIFISPVRYGTGIKTKNLHAMAHGVPLITTTAGSEGMGLQHSKTALFADSAQDFANAVVRLYTDRELWRRLSENGRAHIAEQFSRDRLASLLRDALDRVRDLQPKCYDDGHVWSIRLVEKYFPELLTHYPPHGRTALRILAYARAAEQLAGVGNREEARRQLRHVFSYVPHRVPFEVFFGELFSIAESMERTYRALGEFEGVAEFRREAREYSPGAFPEAEPANAGLARPVVDSEAARSAAPNGGCAHSAASSQPRGCKIDLSVIIPTYNRRETLAACLEALSHQSFSFRRYEAIVIDDGSTDGTEEFCRGYRARFDFRYFHQANAGAGAARRLGVEKARGKFLLLFNDDTIADRVLLAQHWRAHRDSLGAKMAVLGDFRYPESARNRALTHFLSTEPFLFPQVTLAPGDHSKNAYFIASNLSLRRDAVLAAGSFDPLFRIAEDTELGVRLRQMGYHVRYVPEARAIHDHVRFTVCDLVRRAEQYGRTQLLLLRKHPQLLGDGTGPFGRLDPEAIEKLHAYAARQAKEVHEATASLEKFDTLDFTPFFSKPSNGRTAADDVMGGFKVAVPAVFWFHIVRGFLAARKEQRDPAKNSAERVAAREHEVRV